MLTSIHVCLLLCLRLLAVAACSPFTSNDNIYHGAMSIVSGAMKLTEDNASGNYLGFDVIPKLMPISAGSKPASSKPAAYTATLQANIPGDCISYLPCCCVHETALVQC